MTKSSLNDTKIDISKGIWINEFKNSSIETINTISLSVEKFDFILHGYFPESNMAVYPFVPQVIFVGSKEENIIYLFASLSSEDMYLRPVCIREESSDGRFIEEKYFYGTPYKLNLKSINFIAEDYKKIFQSTVVTATHDLAGLPVDNRDNTWYNLCSDAYGGVYGTGPIKPED